MIHYLLSTSILVASLINAQATEDYLNFKNDDTLHGSFAGYSEQGKLIWKSDQAENPISFDTKEIRRLVFNKGRVTKPFTHRSNITLINGDIIPCELLEIAKNEISIRTDFTGELTIPRKKVRAIDIHPNGQKSLYQGPYIKENWKASNFASDDESESEPSWQLTNFSLLFDNKNPGSIVNQSRKLPDSFQMSFDVDLAIYSNVALAFHSDFKKPEIKKEDAKKPVSRISSSQNLMASFGNTMFLNITTSTIALSRYTYDEDGKPKLTSLQNVSGQRLSRTTQLRQKSNIELRVNRFKKTVSVYTNQALTGQWNLEDIGYPAEGTGFGFCSLSSSRNDSISAVSNIVITPWTGIKDSAVSLENEDRDIALLTNGTDRFSGSISNLTDNKISLKSEYAALDIPVDEVKSINFATNKLDTWEAPKDKTVAYRFFGTGRLSATPISGSPNSVKLQHPILGNISVDFNFLSSIDYTGEPSILDDWLNN